MVPPALDKIATSTQHLHSTRHPDGDRYEVPRSKWAPLSAEERARGLAGIRAARDVLEHLAVAS